MGNLILPKTKTMLSAHSYLSEALSPLNQLINLSLFSYAKIYDDGGLIDICSNPEVIEAAYYDKNELYTDISPDICPELLLNEYFLSPCYGSENRALTYLNKVLGLSHVLVITQRSKNFYETFWFGSHEENKFVSFCINNLDVLGDFIQSFKCHFDIKNLMYQCEKDRILRVLPENIKLKNKEFLNKHLSYKKELPFIDCTDSNYTQFYKRILRYQHFKNLKDTCLSKREIDCYYWCVQGKTSEETALLLQISKKTVENHMDNIRKKLSCHNKASLIKKAFALGFLKNCYETA